MQTDFDILIIGAGLVGASLACALQKQDLCIGLVEAVPFDAVNQQMQASYDARTTALSTGSKRILEAMQLWPQLAAQVTPIKTIHVSDQGHFGFTRLHAAEHGLEALGYVVENAVLGRLFAQRFVNQRFVNQRLDTLTNVELICPARVVDIVMEPELARVSIDIDTVVQTVTAKLVVLADGRKSSLREHLGILSRDYQYGQSAVIANISPEHAHASRAYERFTKDGPLALLPMSDKRCSVVWTVADEHLDAVMQLDDAGFLAALQKHFGWRLGRLMQAGKRQCYPLVLSRTTELVGPRLALIGNAAHTLHPIAGQGFNLGLRDVAVLAQVLVDAHESGQDLGDLRVLQDYAAARARDHRRVVALTDTLVRVFSTDFAPLVTLRNLGLLAFDGVPPLKNTFARMGMGLLGQQPRPPSGQPRGLPL